LFTLVKTYNIGKTRNLYAENASINQLSIIKKTKNTDINIFPFNAYLSLEYFCSPFNIRESFNEYSFLFNGWNTNIPFNKGRYDSFMTLLNQNTYIFTGVNDRFYLSKIRVALIEHYNLYTKINIIHKNDHYMLIQLESATM
jgi:hypothetical protein